METELLKADIEGIKKGATFIKNGFQVGFPTETVYGLGADARNDLAVAGIFKSKQRPRFNPLIVHFYKFDDVLKYVELSPTAVQLANNFWPGPLTLVCKLRADSDISPLVTSGLKTLAVRIPSNQVALEFIRLCGTPVAAPSANRSGKISTTNSIDVLKELDGVIPAIIDGGLSEIGLESTIIDVSGKTPILLRHGGTEMEQLEMILGSLEIRKQSKLVNSPGQLSSHYAPDTPMRLNVKTRNKGEVLLGFGPNESDLCLSKNGNLTEAAVNLFSHMRSIDILAKKVGASCIAVAPIPDIGLGMAINDRLKRAASSD